MTARICTSRRSSSYSHTRPDCFWGPPSLHFNGYRGSISDVKRSERDVDQSRQSSVEVESEWSYTSTPLLCFHCRYGTTLPSLYPPALSIDMGWTFRLSTSGGGHSFPTRPDRAWGPPSLLYNGYRVSFPGVKRPGREVDYPPSSIAKVQERVELHFYPPSLWAFMARYREKFTFYL